MKIGLLASALALASPASGTAETLEQAKYEAGVPFNEVSGLSTRKPAAIRASAATNAAIASVVTQMIIRNSQVHGGGTPPPPSPHHGHGTLKRWAPFGLAMPGAFMIAIGATVGSLALAGGLLFGGAALLIGGLALGLSKSHRNETKLGQWIGHFVHKK